MLISLFSHGQSIGNYVFSNPQIVSDNSAFGLDRPRIVVYEKRPGSKFKVRVFYLQLVMMAGR